MTSDNRSSEEIEREIEHERSALTDTLDDLQSRFSVDAIARQFTDQFREHGGEIGRSVSDAVKRNPVALALTGVGLAWLMMGNSSGTRHDRDRPYSRIEHDDFENRGVTGSVGGSRGAARTTYTAHDRPLGSATADPRVRGAGRYSNPDHVPSWARPVETEDDGKPGTVSRLRDAASHAGQSASGAAGSAADAASRAGSRVSEGAKGASGAVSNAGKSAMEGARNAASSASDRAAAFRARLAEGTENLSEEARNRVIAARERAIEARDSAMSYGRQGRDKAVDMFEDQPLVAGAIALAIGAAIGASLPRSQTEDKYLGDYSDSLMDEAERVYAEEKEKLSKVAKAATDEAGKIADETRQAANEAAPADTAAQAAVDKATSSGQRIAGAAENEAKKQKLGDVKKS